MEKKNSNLEAIDKFYEERFRYLEEMERITDKITECLKKMGFDI